MERYGLDEIHVARSPIFAYGRAAKLVEQGKLKARKPEYGKQYLFIKANGDAYPNKYYARLCINEHCLGNIQNHSLKDLNG